jgi:hypothetical protein
MVSYAEPGVVNHGVLLWASHDEPVVVNRGVLC